MRSAFFPQETWSNYYQAREIWERYKLNYSMNLKRQTIKRYAVKSGKLDYKSHSNNLE
jgi:hypothetical protein